MTPTTVDHEMYDRRIRHGWTLEDLATKCAEVGVPVTIQQLSKIERGLHEPRPRLRAALAGVLGLDVRDFDKAVS